MSDVMLHGVLRMPTNLWRDDPIDAAQRRARYLEASDLIHELEIEIERLRASVIEECARVCEAQDATVNVYNNPLNGMKHPVAEQSYRRCAASIRALKEREAGA